MADNVDITAGSGTTVATDQVGTVHYQRVKLVDGTLDSTTAIPGDATNGLDVDVTRVQGTVTVGDGGSSLTVDGTVTSNAGTGFPAVATDGSAIVTTGTLSMGTDGTNAQTIKVAVTGEQYAIVVGDDGAGGWAAASVDPTLTDNESNSVAHLNVHGRNAVYNGVGWDRVRGDTANGMDVDVTRVSGNVTVVQATGSNLNAVVSGTVTANLAAGSNNIGDVDVLTVPAPLSTSGGGTEASALRVTIANDSTGVVSVDDNGGSLTVDGSVTVSQATAGNLNATVVGSGNFTVVQSTAGNLNATVQGTVTANAGTGFGIATAGSAQLSTGPQIMGSDGTLATRIQTTAAGVLKTDGSATTQPVSGTVTANLAAGTNNIGDVDVLSVPAPLSTTGGGTEATALRVTVANDSTGVLSVDDNGGSLTVDGTVTANLAAGTNNIGDVDVLTVPAPLSTTGNGTAATALRVTLASDTTGLLDVEGAVAHDGVDSGNPIKLGARAIAHGTNPTAVAAADRTDLYANRAGVLFTIGGHPNVQVVSARFTTAQTNTALVTVAAGLKIVVTRVTVTADNANTVDVGAVIGFGATTTPATSSTPVTGIVLAHPGIAKGSGVVEGNGSGIIGVGTDDQDLRITSEVPTGGSIDVTVSYYTIES